MKYALLLAILLVTPAHAQLAVWGNHTYNSPVCNNRNCQMCNSIRMQLSTRPQPQPRRVLVSAPAQPVAVQTVHTTRVAVRERVPVLRRVKVCHGTWCEYVMQTTYETRVVYKDIPTPTSPEKTLGVDLLHVDKLEPMPDAAVVGLMEILQPTPGDLIWDLGCGEGKVLIASAINGAKATGIEINPSTVMMARTNIQMACVSHLVRIYEGDILNYNLDQCSTVTMFLFPSLMERIFPRLRSGTRVVSYIYPIRGGTKIESNGHVFYEWVKP